MREEISSKDIFDRRLLPNYCKQGGKLDIHNRGCFYDAIHGLSEPSPFGPLTFLFAPKRISKQKKRAPLTFACSRGRTHSSRKCH